MTLLALLPRLGALAVNVTALREGASFVVDVGEDVVAARVAGVVLERLQGGASAEWGASAQRPVDDSAAASTHPLVAAVEGRVRGAVQRRFDGVVVSSFDVETFDRSEALFD